MAASTKSIEQEIIEKGRLFAKNAQYGKPKWMIAKVNASSAASVPAGSNGHDAVERKEDLNPYIAPVSSAEVQAAAYVPSKSGEASASLTATAGPSTGSKPITVLAPLLTKSEDLEHAVYFQSWGKPEERTGPGKYKSTLCINDTSVLMVTATAAGKRKVIITGDPAWESTPKPDFIASLVFGGPLEQILCLSSSAIVTFINPNDAQAYYDGTPNGIIFRKTPECLHYAEVRLDNDVTPISSIVQQHFDDKGATRCVKATGVDVATSLEDLHKLGNGPMNSRGQIPRKLERLVDDTNASGVSTPSLGLFISR